MRYDPTGISEQPRPGTTAVITGAARGLGKAFATALAARGTSVALIDRDEPTVQAAAADIRDLGFTARAYAGDVTDEDRMKDIMAEVASIQGGIDVLINNAGLHTDDSKPILQMGLQGTRRLFDVNVLGVVACTLSSYSYMTDRPGASIVNIASAAAHFAGASLTSYGASKLAVAGLTVTLAAELGPMGVRVNAISPGLILTETVRGRFDESTQSYIRTMQMLDISGAEADIVNAMLFLTSPQARFITGETLRVTGGMAAGT